MSSSTATLYKNQPVPPKFKQEVIDYCQAQKYDLKLLDLSEAEFEHLYWNIGNDYTPEAGKNPNYKADPSFFEIERSIARCYAFALLLRGTDEDYLEFVRGQEDDVKLSHIRFHARSVLANHLPPNVQAVIRASAFLVKSPALKARCEAAMTDEVRQLFEENKLSIEMSTDGEEFLSQFAIIASVRNDVSPITRRLAPEQNALLPKLFWPNLHMRWLYSTEGSVNMIASLVRGIKEGKFNGEADLIVWSWRWILNIAGFQGGPGAKFYDRVSDQLVTSMLTELVKLFDDVDYKFVHQYLEENVKKSRLDRSGQLIHKHSTLLYGHFITYLAYFHRVDIFDVKNAVMLIAGVSAYRDRFPDSQLGASYVRSLENDDAVTPTYLPGLMDTALTLSKAYLNVKADGLLKENELPVLPEKLNAVSVFRAHPEKNDEAVALATEFMCQAFDEVYKTKLSKRVSAMKLAKPENLKPVMEAWLYNRELVQLALTDTMEIKANVKTMKQYLEEQAEKEKLEAKQKTDQQISSVSIFPRAEEKEPKTLEDYEALFAEVQDPPQKAPTKFW